MTAADRLLSHASDLFCREGIRGVGIDRILAEANVAKATLYHSFGSKEALVVAHLERRDADDRERHRAYIADLPVGIDRVLASFDLAEQRAATGGYIGCVYLNALTEFPEPDAPIGVAVRRHRLWLQEQWSTALESSPDAGRLVAATQILYDGALLGSKITQSREPFVLARDVVRSILAG